MQALTEKCAQTDADLQTNAFAVSFNSMINSQTTRTLPAGKMLSPCEMVDIVFL